MPELPEVETIRRMLEPAVVGRRILGLEHDDERKYRFTDLAVGRYVRAIRRRGKFLLFDLDDLEMVVHLGMSGSLRLDQGSHTRVRIELEGQTVFFNDPRRFGRLAVLPRGDYAAFPTLARMGPEPLSRSFTAAGFYRSLQRSRRAIKTALLSQEPVAGLGNIYTDESLWLARINPLRKSSSLTLEEARRLHRAIRKVLRRALELGGSTLGDGVYLRPSGEPGYFQIEHRVYGRAGESCPRCGATIFKTVLGGRSTHFCPLCQPRASHM
ncbi:bifunctional DNA-formamidopyrimidine glycosylase/DNA-(apurinic or apyrimidinic site) lyase [Oceanithermus sp.]